ncbi:MAG: TetR/AcrR family transcriptional regulator [Myxococcota bacterium]
MARTVDHKKREEIAQAAFALIRAQGVQSTSMTDIARALGMKRPTLYWYFKDLAAIFEAVLQHMLSDLAQHLLEATEAAAHPIDRLDAHARAVHGYFATRRDIIPCLIELWTSSQKGGTLDADRAMAFTQMYAQPRRQRMIDDLRKGIEEGIVAPCDPEAIVQLVIAVVDGMLVQQLLRPAHQIPPVHDALWEHVLRPLKRNPS